MLMQLLSFILSKKMSRSKKETKPIKVYSVNPQDIDLDRVTEIIYHFLKENPNILERVEIMSKQEKQISDSFYKEIINNEKSQQIK